MIQADSICEAKDLATALPSVRLRSVCDLQHWLDWLWHEGFLMREAVGLLWTTAGVVAVQQRQKLEEKE